LILLVALLGLALLVYVGGPVLVHSKLKQAADPRLIPFPVDHPDLPKDADRTFQSVIDQLRPAGFEPVTGLAMPDQTPNVKAIMLVLANRPAKDSAFVTIAYARVVTQGSAEWQKKSYSVEFVSNFRDGTAVHTTNTRTPAVMAPWPGHAMARFPDVQNARRLYRLHRGLVARAPSPGQVFRVDEEFRGDAAAAVAASAVEQLEAQVPAGYMYLAPDEGVYRPTWKGAFLMTWRLLWPVTALRRTALDRRARRLMAELEAEPRDPA
jgi:hypothetical protein